MSTASQPTAKDNKKRSLEERIDILEAQTEKEGVSLAQAILELAREVSQINTHTMEHCVQIAALKARDPNSKEDTKKVKLEFIFPEDQASFMHPFYLHRACTKCDAHGTDQPEDAKCPKSGCDGRWTQAAYINPRQPDAFVKKEAATC